MGKHNWFFYGNVFFVFRCFKRSLNKENCIINEEKNVIERFLGKGEGGGGREVGMVRRTNQRCNNIK